MHNQKLGIFSSGPLTMEQVIVDGLPTSTIPLEVQKDVKNLTFQGSS